MKATRVKVGKLVLELLGGYLSGEIKVAAFAPIIEEDNAKVLVEIQPVYEDPDDEACPAELPEDARVGLAWFMANEAALAEVVIGALRAKFKAKLPAKGGLRDTLDFVSLHVHEVSAGDLPYLGLELRCSWDEEHGVGVLVHGTRVVKIGQADTAILEWIAEADAKKLAKKKPAAKKKKATKKKTTTKATTTKKKPAAKKKR